MKHSPPTQRLTDRLASLGEMIRLRILRLLEREELSVGEMARVVQLPQSTVSRHLKVLSDGGWLVKRTEGTATLYRMVLDDLAADARALWLTVREQLTPSAELGEDTRRLAGVLAERRADSQAFFGRVAGQWDDVRNELFGHRFTLQALLALLPNDWTVADLGCGTGNASELFAPLVRRVIAVDQSPPMLKAARKRLAAFSNVTFLKGDLERVPLEDGAVDAAVCILVMHHIPDPGAACREIRRIVRPGGTALIVDMLQHDRASYKHTMGHHWLGFTEEQLAAYLRGAGFASHRFFVLPSDPESKGPGLFACKATAPA